MSMRIFLDDEACTFEAQTIGEAVAQAAALAEQAGRMVVDVIVDGSPLSESNLDDDATQSMEAEEVKLISADPVELVLQTLSEANAALQDADELQRGAAEAMQADQMQEGLTQLADAFDLWTAVHDAVVKGTALLEIDLDAISLDGDGAAQRVERLAKELRLVREALTNSDPVLLSDTLLYQLPEVVMQWRELIAELQQHIRSHSDQV